MQVWDALDSADPISPHKPRQRRPTRPPNPPHVSSPRRRPGRALRPWFCVPDGCYALVTRFGKDEDYDDGQPIWPAGFHFGAPWVKVQLYPSHPSLHTAAAAAGGDVVGGVHAPRPAPPFTPLPSYGGRWSS